MSTITEAKTRKRIKVETESSLHRGGGPGRRPALVTWGTFEGASARVLGPWERPSARLSPRAPDRGLPRSKARGSVGDLSRGPAPKEEATGPQQRP